jgi:hypothetical protein
MARLTPDLLQPSLQGPQARDLPEGHRPWRLDSLLWVAFFGGITPIAVLGVKNARRLGTGRLVGALVALGIVGFLAVFAINAVGVAHFAFVRNHMRLAQRAVALLYYLFLRQRLTAPMRVHEAGGGQLDSLWKPGLIAVFALGFLENLLVILLVSKVFA